jgi:hypothetical protein
MTSNKKAQPPEMKVVAVVRIQTGSRENPKCACPGEQLTLPYELALALLATGKARRAED